MNSFWFITGLAIGVLAMDIATDWREPRPTVVNMGAAPPCHRPFICGNSGECYPILGVPEPEICVYLAAHRGY